MNAVPPVLTSGTGVCLCQEMRTYLLSVSIIKICFSTIFIYHISVSVFLSIFSCTLSLSPLHTHTHTHTHTPRLNALRKETYHTHTHTQTKYSLEGDISHTHTHTHTNTLHSPNS